jgi:hypothetical protein
MSVKPELLVPRASMQQLAPALELARQLERCLTAIAVTTTALTVTPLRQAVKWKSLRRST